MKEFPPFRLDPGNQCLWRRTEVGDDERIRLTPKAFAVLQYLVEHAGRLVTHDELLEAVWPETYVQPEVLKSHIFDVRRALGDRAKQPRFIETIARRGYQFIAVVHEGGAADPAAPPPRHRLPLTNLPAPASDLIGRAIACSRRRGPMPSRNSPQAASSNRSHAATPHITDTSSSRLRSNVRHSPQPSGWRIIATASITLGRRWTGPFRRAATHRSA